ncbi:DUF6056 family protein, partial [Flavobacterium sp.]|uniref:DUF6056 family protein n=1 Tax=Flavobacterium sp. TaxID=239 RepID=UPI003752CEA6
MNDNFLKIFKNSVCIVGLISLFSILILSVNTFYWADDYSFMLKIKSKGIIGNCIYGYNNWEGRFLTLGAFFQGFLIKYFRVEFITLVWSSLFLTSGLLMIKIIFSELNSVIFNKINYYLIAISLAILLWLGAYFHVAETVYWATGGIYSFFLLQCSVWIIFYLNFQKGNFTTFQKIFFLVFCFFSGASSQNLAVAFLALIAISILLDYLKNDKTNNKWNYLFFLFVFLGVLFISIAPGNFVRMKVNGMTHFDMSFYGILRGIILTLKSYIIWS